MTQCIYEMKALFLYLAALVNSDAKQLILLSVVAPNVENRHQSLSNTAQYSNLSHVSLSIHQRLIGSELHNIWFPATLDLIGTACFLCPGVGWLQSSLPR